jgi:hypothetical protein
MKLGRHLAISSMVFWRRLRALEGWERLGCPANARAFNHILMEQYEK